MEIDRPSNRFLNCPKFGDTVTSLSLKCLKAIDENSKPISLSFRNFDQTFGQVVKRYLITMQPVQSSNTTYAIQYHQTHEMISDGKRLQLYKHEIQDPQQVYFRIYPIETQKMIQINEQLSGLIVESVIQNPDSGNATYNIKIVVLKPSSQVVEIVINKFCTLKMLKLEICKKEKLEYNQFQLIYAGKKIDVDDRTLDQCQIEDEAMFMLAMVVKLGCFSPHSLISIDKDKTVRVNQLKRGDKVLSYNVGKGAMDEDQIISIHKTMLSSYLQVTLQNGTMIQCTPNHKFLFSDGTWASFNYQQGKQRLKVGDCLTNASLSPIKITKITPIDTLQPLQFLHISTLQHHNFILNGFIAHNMEVKLLNTADGREFTLNVTESDTIEMIKIKMEEILKISKHQLLIVLNKKELKDGESISDYIQDIKNCNYLQVIQHLHHTIVVNRLKTKREYRFKLNKQQFVRDLKKKISTQAEIDQDHLILILNNMEMHNGQKIGEFELHTNFNRVNLIQVEDEVISQSKMKSDMKKILHVRMEENDYLRLNYFSLREMRVEQFITSFVQNSKKCYSLLFGEVILKPTDFLKQIQNHPYINNQEINCYVVKCYDRLVFYNTLNFATKFDLPALQMEKYVINAFRTKHAAINEKLSKTDFYHTIKAKFNEHLEEFYQPIQIFTNSKSSLILQSYLERFVVSETQHIHQIKGHNLCSSVVKSLESIPSFIGQTHRVIPGVRFRDIYDKKGDTLYVQSFLSAHTSKESIPQVHQINYTLLHIQSLTGRPIGLISDVTDEVVFLPFTYFYIKKITPGVDHDEVWLVEVPTPLSFQKDVFMWVDDEPNSKENRGICNLIDFSRYELVQLTSTVIAEYWMKQFGWILKWMGRKIKVMSDMNRAEGENDAMVHQAGINLVQSFHNDYGYTTPIFIYCKNSHAARRAMQARMIKPGRIQKITNDEFELINFLTAP